MAVTAFYSIAAMSTGTSTSTSAAAASAQTTSDELVEQLRPVTPPVSSPPHRPASSSTSPSRPDRRALLPPSPILLLPLPPSSSITKESLAQSELELDRQSRELQRERELAEALQEQQWEIERAAVRDSKGSWRGKKGKERENAGGPSKGFEIPPQAYELYQAIDKHDIDFIMRVRDHAFPLLLQKNAGEFPIVYAARIGPSHRDVVILLVGALSRYVNHLDDEDFEKKETKATLKALRSNLKLAIDNALLPASSSSLLSSYLQVLIMSEGDTFIHKSVYDISLLLRDASGTSKPVKGAEDIMRRFCTKELRGVEGGVSGVEEYIANAIIDLVMMAAWSIAAQQMEGNVPGLPTHTFARDLRTWQMLKEAMEDNKGQLSKVNRRIRGILERLLDLGGDTKQGIRGRLRQIELALDGE